jgi:hypothetical protein
MPPRAAISANTPLRLSVAAAVAFPDASMTAAGLRREAERGRLVIERIAGKDYTTLANIERMRELCRVEAKAPTCGSGVPGERTAASLRALSGSSSTAGSMSPRDALSIKLDRSCSTGNSQEFDPTHGFQKSSMA